MCVGPLCSIWRSFSLYEYTYFLDFQGFQIFKTVENLAKIEKF